MLHLGHMLALGIISSSNLFMWHPTVNLAYSIPHLMNHRTIHRNIKEKLPKNIKSEKKWRKWEKVKKMKNWENLIWHWRGNAFFGIDPQKIKNTNWKNWENLRKCFLEKTQIATWGEDETMHQRLGAGVDYTIVLHLVPSPTFSFAQVCDIFPQCWAWLI